MINYPFETESAAGLALIKEAPQRIACLSNSFFDFFKEIEALDKICAKTGEAYNHNDHEIVSVGPQKDPDVELILECKPDLVLTGPELLFENPQLNEKLKEVLTEKNIPYLAYDPETISKLCEIYDLLGELVDKEQQAKSLAKRIKVEAFNLKARLINRRLRQNLKKKTVFIDVGDFTAPGEPTLLNDLCEIIGVVNLTGDEQEKYKQFNPEEIAINDTDIYLSFVTPVEKLKKEPQISTTTAAKNNQIYFIDNPLKLIGPGPEITQTIEDLAKLIDG